jgi:hypothetical protein
MLSFLNQTHNFGADYMMQSSSRSHSGSSIGITLGFYVIIYLVIAWINSRIFKKAGRKGWIAFVPFYNSYTLYQISGKPGWWFILGIIPIVNIVVLVLAMLELARRFGKSVSFAIFGLILFSFIGLLILAFDDDKYQVEPDVVNDFNNPPKPGDGSITSIAG